MHGTIIESGTDQTFESIAERAAGYPVVEKMSQLRIIRKGASGDSLTRDPGIQWLLSDTLATSRIIRGIA